MRTYMSEINKQPENQYTRGLIIKRAAGPTKDKYASKQTAYL